MRIVDREDFAALIQSLTGLQTVYWATNNMPYISDTDRMSVELEVFSIRSQGVDEHRYALSPAGYPTGQWVVTEVGNREVTITMRVRAFDANVDAAEMLDQIKTLLRSAASTATLNGLNLALEWAGPSIRIKEDIDTRAISCSVADFKFGGISSIVSDSELNQGWVDTVNTTDIVPGTLTP